MRVERLRVASRVERLMVKRFRAESLRVERLRVVEG